MAYADKQNMIDRFGETELIQVSNRDIPGDVINDEAFAQAQQDGDAEIDAYLQGRYPLPLTHVPPVLCRLACDLYRYYLYTPRTTEEVEKRYDAAIKFLKDVSKGEVNLGIDATDQQPAETAHPIRVTSSPRRFSKERMEKY